VPTDSFTTASGVEVPAVTAEQMREVDRVAVEEFGLQLLQMMENAGRTLAWHVRDAGRDPVTVMAGNGGNGGGGLACARHLSNKGRRIEVVLDREPDELDGAAANQLQVLRRMDVPVRTGTGDDVDGETLVDALVGYGLAGDLRGPTRSLVEAVEHSSATVVSLDVPSGRDATTGEVLGIAVDPDRTVTLALPKTGLTDGVGELFLADISIPAAVYEHLGLPYERPFGDAYWTRLSDS
jgi:NAD(P)H-hydrate epimerase